LFFKSVKKIKENHINNKNNLIKLNKRDKEKQKRSNEEKQRNQDSSRQMNQKLLNTFKT